MEFAVSVVLCVMLVVDGVLMAISLVRNNK